MCIFSANVKLVSQTYIIAGKTKSGKARIIYGNSVACKNGNIMVLPVDSDKVKLIELSKNYKTLGKDLITSYMKFKNHGKKSKSKSMTKAEVIKYGPYIVSITKDLTEVNWKKFGGLEKSKNFYKLMNEKYKNHSFIIAKIEKPYKKSDKNKLPICYEFSPNNKKIMLPTFHIHGGVAEEKPLWDHYIVILNGLILDKDNTSKTSKRCNQIILENKELFYQYFACLNNLFSDKIFKKDRFRSFKYISITRILDKSFPNIDLLFKTKKNHGIKIKKEETSDYE